MARRPSHQPPPQAGLDMVSQSSGSLTGHSAPIRSEPLPSGDPPAIFRQNNRSPDGENSTSKQAVSPVKKQTLPPRSTKERTRSRMAHDQYSSCPPLISSPRPASRSSSLCRS